MSTNDSVTIACVYRTGGVYTSIYVRNLYHSLRRHLGRDIVLTCLTDDPDAFKSKDYYQQIRIIPLNHHWHGWWAKMELFRLNGPVLYFDLDTLIVGNVTELLPTKPGFYMINDFYKPERAGSGVMAWWGNYSFLYEQFQKNASQIMHEWNSPDKWGDQAFIHHNLQAAGHAVEFFRKKCPHAIVSYKVHCDRGIPMDAKVICFHGEPKPHMLDNWAGQLWKYGKIVK